MIFEGQYNREIFEEYAHWQSYITDIFRPIVGIEHGDFIHFPHGDNLYNEDYIEMQILFHIQNAYREILKKKQDKIGRY